MNHTGTTRTAVLTGVLCFERHRNFAKMFHRTKLLAGEMNFSLTDLLFIVFHFVNLFRNNIVCLERCQSIFYFPYTCQQTNKYPKYSVHIHRLMDVQGFIRFYFSIIPWS